MDRQSDLKAIAQCVQDGAEHVPHHLSVGPELGHDLVEPGWWSAGSLVRLSELEPTATAFYRVALAAPAFLLFSFARREAPSLTAFSKAQWLGLFWLIAAGAFFALDLFCLHWSLRRTSVVNATLFLNFAPIFVSLGAWAIFGELATRRAVLSYVTAIGGVALLLGGVATFERGKLFGDVLGLADPSFW
jgi:drug/metabolite transporter (DMT)-like permease